MKPSPDSCGQPYSDECDCSDCTAEHIRRYFPDDAALGGLYSLGNIGVAMRGVVEAQAAERAFLTPVSYRPPRLSSPHFFHPGCDCWECTDDPRFDSDETEAEIREGIR